MMRGMTGVTQKTWAVLLVAVIGAAAGAETPAGANAVFDSYAARLETRRQSGGIQMTAADREWVRRGEVMIEKQAPAADTNPPGAMLHDWRGMAFAPGATAADFELLMRNFSSYPEVYAPEVVRSAVLKQEGDWYQVKMRVRQKHVLTVVLDTTYDVSFERAGGKRGWSTSRSTRIEEIEAAGTPKEKALTAAEEHGFLWRLNTYWSYEERDGGLYVEIESVSLTRAIPTGLGWAVRPFVESVPRESLEFTLRKTCEALKRDRGTR